MKWYRSLYWRIALGVVAFLAAMLVVQAMLFVWAVSQSGRTLPGQSPGRLGQTVALDLANLLERDAQADIAKYVREQYAQYTHPFFVMMADGRLITSGSKSFPEPLIRMARARLQRPRPEGPRLEGTRPEGPRPEGPWPGGWRPEGPPPDLLPRDGPRPPDFPRPEGLRPERPRGPRPDWWEQPDRFLDRFERDPDGVRFIRPSPIVVGGRLAGVVVVPPQAPFGFLLGRFAPMLALVGGGVLIVGTVLTSVLIFGPARRRLRALETAARRLGSGDLSARAPEKGGDEIAAVASAFNAMADDLAVRADALAASDRARRQLLADVSHELNTPVTAVRGYLETLTMPELTLDEATRARYLTIIGDETARLERLIGDLLDLARLEGGGGTLRHEAVTVGHLFARVAARHERACETAGVTLTTSIAPGVETVIGDQDRLEEALQNLAANALRYAPRGTAVRLTAYPTPDAATRGTGVGTSHHDPTLPPAPAEDVAPSVAISVEDEGPGIAPEHLPHIFDRFYKADASRAEVSGGSGLGLSIVKAIVERLGGRISVVSRPGRTVFEITLPR
jgi:signal transduction histidine kinase